MKTNFNFITIKDLASRITRHPLLQNVSIEDIIYYTIDFIHEHGHPEFFTKESEIVTVKNYRAELPCNLVKIEGVSYKGEYLLATTGIDNIKKSITHHYKIQGSFLFTDIEEGELNIAYLAIPIDKDGFPMIPDHPLFLKALELYIKKELFTIMFDSGQLQGGILSNAKTDYAWAARVMKEEFRSLSEAEMESLSNMLNRLLPYKSSFTNGFRGLKDPEQYKYK